MRTKIQTFFRTVAKKKIRKMWGPPKWANWFSTGSKEKKITFYSLFASNKPKKAFPLVQDFKKFCKQIAHFRVNG